MVERHKNSGRFGKLENMKWYSDTAVMRELILKKDNFRLTAKVNARFVHAPLVQEFGEMMIRNVENRIRSRADCGWFCV